MRNWSLKVDRGNFGLGIALLLVVLIGGAILLGPGRGRLADAAERVDFEESRIVRWRENGTRTSPMSPREWETWAREWQRFMEVVPTSRDGTEAIAALGRAVGRPGLKHLDLEETTLSSRNEEDDTTHTASSPHDDAKFEIDSRTARLRFSTGYRTITEVLGEAVAREIPARIERVRITKAPSALSVTMDVTLFGRESGAP